MNIFVSIISALLFLIPSIAFSQLNVFSGNSVHISLGIPYDNDPSDDYIIFRPQYVLSYNPKKGVPNWVSYELNSNWFGAESRYSGRFITDTTLPKNFYRVTHDDYTNSSFDRVHMVRSYERTRTAEDNRSTFIMTNIIPQTPDLNRCVWLNFEYFCEHLCLKEEKQLFIITGPVIHTDSTIDGLGKVAVPDSCFKIVVVLDRNQNINHINEFTSVIAVVMPT